MCDKVEKEYKDLIKRKEILSNDKFTLNSNMDQLDHKKKKLWKNVI